RVLVEAQVVALRARARRELRGETFGEDLHPLGDGSYVRRGRWPAPGVPECAASEEVGSERLTLALDALGQERIAVRQPRGGLRPRPVFGCPEAQRSIQRTGEGHLMSTPGPTPGSMTVCGYRR